MNHHLIDSIIQSALNEDITSGDITSDHLIDPGFKSDLVFLLKEEGVVSGLDIAKRTFQLLDPEIVWQPLVEEGEMLGSDTPIARVKGCSRILLAGERVALNFMQRMSGISTKTYRFVERMREGSESCRLLDTRKTTPGLRLLERYAVKVGGGHNHRFNLSDAVLIKDNHLATLKANGISPEDAIVRLKKRIPHTIKVELEVDSIQQIKPFLGIGIDIFLLDNMDIEELMESVKLINRRSLTEASGGVTLERIAEIAATGVDFISAGALTHSASALDISLDFA